MAKRSQMFSGNQPTSNRAASHCIGVCFTKTSCYQLALLSFFLVSMGNLKISWQRLKKWKGTIDFDDMLCILLLLELFFALGMFCYYHCCQFWTLKFTVFDVKISAQGCNIYKENIAIKIKLWRGCSHPWVDSRINTENLIFFYFSEKQETIWKTFISIWEKILLTIHNHYQSILRCW